MSNVLIIWYAKENGTDIDIRMIMDIVEHASKKKMKYRKGLRKILILISCSIA